MRSSPWPSSWSFSCSLADRRVEAQRPLDGSPWRRLHQPCSLASREPRLAVTNVVTIAGLLATAIASTCARVWSRHAATARMLTRFAAAGMRAVSGFSPARLLLPTLGPCRARRMTRVGGAVSSWFRCRGCCRTPGIGGRRLRPPSRPRHPPRAGIGHVLLGTAFVVVVVGSPRPRRVTAPSARATATSVCSRSHHARTRCRSPGTVRHLAVDPTDRRGTPWRSASSSASRRPQGDPMLIAAGGGCAREESPLRLEVVLHRPVKVEVVLAQVREDESVEADPVETPERGSVRGRLEGDAPVARVSISRRTDAGDRSLRGW